MADRERLREFIAAECWAVVGASDDREKYGNLTFRELVSRGKRVYPVNPGKQEVEGVICYPNLSALPEQVDRVLIVIPPDRENRWSEKPKRPVWPTCGSSQEPSRKRRWPIARPTGSRPYQVTAYCTRNRSRGAWSL